VPPATRVPRQGGVTAEASTLACREHVTGQGRSAHAEQTGDIPTTAAATHRAWARPWRPTPRGLRLQRGWSPPFPMASSEALACADGPWCARPWPSGVVCGPWTGRTWPRVYACGASTVVRPLW